MVMAPIRLIRPSVSSWAPAGEGTARRSATAVAISSRRMEVSFCGHAVRVENEGTVASLPVEAQPREAPPSALYRDPGRRLPDVDVRAGGGARHGRPGRDEGDAGRAQVVHQCPYLRAVGMHRDVERAPVIEAHAVVQRRLAVGAYRQRPAEARHEELLELDRVRLEGP